MVCPLLRKNWVARHSQCIKTEDKVTCQGITQGRVSHAKTQGYKIIHGSYSVNRVTFNPSLVHPYFQCSPDCRVLTVITDTDSQWHCVSEYKSSASLGTQSHTPSLAGQCVQH